MTKKEIAAYKTLWAAVLGQAFEDICDKRGRTRQRGYAAARHSACELFFSMRLRPHLKRICRFLDLNPDEMVKRARELETEYHYTNRRKSNIRITDKIYRVPRELHDLEQINA